MAENTVAANDMERTNRIAQAAQAVQDAKSVRKLPTLILRSGPSLREIAREHGVSKSALDRATRSDKRPNGRPTHVTQDQDAALGAYIRRVREHFPRTQLRQAVEDLGKQVSRSWIDRFLRRHLGAGQQSAGSLHAIDLTFRKWLQEDSQGREFAHFFAEPGQPENNHAAVRRGDKSWKDPQRYPPPKLPWEYGTYSATEIEIDGDMGIEDCFDADSYYASERLIHAGHYVTFRTSEKARVRARDAWEIWVHDAPDREDESIVAVVKQIWADMVSTFAVVEMSLTDKVNLNMTPRQIQLRATWAAVCLHGCLEPRQGWYRIIVPIVPAGEVCTVAISVDDTETQMEWDHGMCLVLDDHVAFSRLDDSCMDFVRVSVPMPQEN